MFGHKMFMLGIVLYTIFDEKSGEFLELCVLDSAVMMEYCTKLDLMIFMEFHDM